MTGFYYTNALFPGIGLTVSLCPLSTVAQAGKPQETWQQSWSKMRDKVAN